MRPFLNAFIKHLNGETQSGSDYRKCNVFMGFALTLEFRVLGED